MRNLPGVAHRRVQTGDIRRGESEVILLASLHGRQVSAPSLNHPWLFPGRKTPQLVPGASPAASPSSSLQLSATTQAALSLSSFSAGTSNNSNRAALDPASSTAAAHPIPPSLLPLSNNSNTNAPARPIRLIPHLESYRSLQFDVIGRDLREGDSVLCIGRFTGSSLGLAAINSISSNKLAFRSKVVSRTHAEIWVEAGDKFLIRDIKSSSGTFLNHVRLSVANTESQPFQIKETFSSLVSIIWTGLKISTRASRFELRLGRNDKQALMPSGG